MQHRLRYHAIAVGILMGLLLFRILAIGLGLCFLSVAGLLIVQHYWLAMLVLVSGLLVYEGGYWLLIGQWRR